MSELDEKARHLLDRLKHFSDAPSDKLSDERWHFDVLPAMRCLQEALAAAPAPMVSGEPVAFTNGPCNLGYGAGDHLMWIAARMEHVHGENPNYDYMMRLREIARALAGEKP